MDKELIEAIKMLTTSVDELKSAIFTNTTRMEDLMNNDPHDMMRTLNGSLQELIKTLESKK
jgi:hypothetical protein